MEISVKHPDVEQPRTGWDKAWFVVTETCQAVTMCAVALLWIMVGSQLPAFLRLHWDGSLIATESILVFIVLSALVVNLLPRLVVEVFQWVLAFLEELASPDDGKGVIADGEKEVAQEALK
jgi:hypothetical protein